MRVRAPGRPDLQRTNQSNGETKPIRRTLQRLPCAGEGSRRHRRSARLTAVVSHPMPRAHARRGPRSTQTSRGFKAPVNTPRRAALRALTPRGRLTAAGTPQLRAPHCPPMHTAGGLARRKAPCQRTPGRFDGSTTTSVCEPSSICPVVRTRASQVGGAGTGWHCCLRFPLQPPGSVCVQGTPPPCLLNLRRSSTGSSRACARPGPARL